MNPAPPAPLTPNLDSLFGLTMETDGARPLLVGIALKAVEDALTALPRLYPGITVRDRRLSPSQVEILVDLGRSDEDVYRIVQSFKREVKARLKTQETLWTWEYAEIQGLNPGDAETLGSRWNLSGSPGVPVPGTRTKA